MGLTKQEQAIIIDMFISMLGPGVVNKRINKQKLESVVPIFNEIDGR